MYVIKQHNTGDPNVATMDDRSFLAWFKKMFGLDSPDTKEEKAEAATTATKEIEYL